MPEPTDRPAFWIPASKSASDLSRTYHEPITKHTSQKDLCFQDSKPGCPEAIRMLSAGYPFFIGMDHHTCAGSPDRPIWCTEHSHGAHFVALILPRSMQHSIQHKRWALPCKQLCYTGLASNRVKYNTISECGTSQNQLSNKHYF